MEKLKALTGVQKALLIVGFAVVALIALLLITVLCLHLFTPVVFNDFFSNAKAEYVTPGIYEGLVPQGYAYEGERGIYLQCGYMADGESASRIYVTDADNTDETYFVELYTADGKPYTGHTGGITSAFGFVWLANDGEGDDNCVWVIKLADILSAENGGKITLNTNFKSETRAACCFVDGRYLWIGEFNNSEEYATKETHTFTVSGGENKALVCAYALDIDSKYGVASETVNGKDIFTPVMALSVTDLVQGFTKTPDGFALSTSYGINPSHLYFYEDVTKDNADASIKINEKDVPVYFLDADALTKEVVTTPMTEEIFVKDGKLYVLFESACQKYIFGNLIRGIHIYSYDLD